MSQLRRALNQVVLAGSWCLVLTFTTALLAVRSAAEESEGWPREIEISSAEIVVYQPQLESFEGN